MRSLTIATVTLITLGGSLGAQVCVGSASFASGPARIGAGMNFTDGAKSFGLQLAGGSPEGAFVSGSVSRIEYDNVSGGGTGLGATAGYAVAMNPAKTVQFCPLASFEYEKLPTIDTGVGTFEGSAHAFGVGGAIGGVIPASPTLDFVPFVGAQYRAVSTSASFGGISGSGSGNYTEVEVGAGFVLNHALTIRPAVAIPVGSEDGKSTFEIAFAFNFGASSPRK